MSSFGFSGTNAHVVLEEAPAVARRRRRHERPRHLLALSARDRAGAARAGASASRTASTTQPPTSLGRRLLHRQRRPRALRAPAGGRGRRPPSRRATRLDALSRRGATRRGDRRSRGDASAPRVAFLFTGQGAQYAGMGARALRRRQPVFRAGARPLRRAAARPCSSGRCCAVLYPRRSDGLAARRDRLHPAGAVRARVRARRAVARWGVEPGAVLGHSVGEYVAACVAGVCSLEDGAARSSPRAAG